MVSRSGAARLDAHRAALRLDLHGEFGEVHADLVVMSANIGCAQALAVRQEVGVPGKNGNARSLGSLQRHCHGRGIGWRYGNAVHLLGDEILQDLHLLLAAAVFAGADIHAFKGTL